MYSVHGVLSSTGRVAPFGDLRIKARLRLPEAYRSLPRPSSPAGAKASIMCSLQLDHPETFLSPARPRFHAVTSRLAYNYFYLLITRSENPPAPFGRKARAGLPAFLMPYRRLSSSFTYAVVKEPDRFRTLSRPCRRPSETYGPGRLRPAPPRGAGWWAYLELNQRPRPYQGRALTN